MPDLELEFIQYAVKALVTKPEAVRVERETGERGDVLLLTVDPEDMGKVIGKAGATARSLRTLLRAMASQDNKATGLKIVEPDGNEEPAAQLEAVEVIDADLDEEPKTDSLVDDEDELGAGRRHGGRSNV